MRTRTAFNPVPSPRLSKPPSEEVFAEATSPASNSTASIIPNLVFDATGQIRNIGAVVTALKAAVENLAGQRGDPPDRAVTFRDLVEYGLLTPDAVISSRGEAGAAEFRLPRQPKRRA